MHIIKISFTLIIISIVGLQAFGANDKFYLNKLNYCKITQPQVNDYEPEAFQPSNNLLRSSGKQPIYCGKKIIISGRVLDQNCVPIADAKVYLWQVGCDGKYPYPPLRTNIGQKMLNLSNGSSFRGSGTATTNNKGEFHFITIYPPALRSHMPYVNIRVKHYRLGTLQTKLFLSSQQILPPDEELNENLATSSQQGEIYYFDIVMPGEGLKQY